MSQSDVFGVLCLGIPFWINFINYFVASSLQCLFWHPFGASKIHVQPGPAKEEKNKTRYLAQPQVRQQHEDIVRDIQESEHHAKRFCFMLLVGQPFHPSNNRQTHEIVKTTEEVKSMSKSSCFMMLMERPFHSSTGQTGREKPKERP